MQKIGEGYWYNVYRLENERVLKIQKTILEKIRDSYKKERKNFYRWLKTVRNLICDVNEISTNYRYIKNNVDLSLLGMPTFLRGIDYEQDRVWILGVILQSCTLEERRSIIDLYIDNIIDCWKYGFADKLFNFTINNGLDRTGRMIFIDFNEISLFKEDIILRIKKKTWTNSWSLRQVDLETRSYYLAQMDLRITLESLETNWRKALKK